MQLTNWGAKRTRVQQSKVEGMPTISRLNANEYAATRRRLRHGVGHATWHEVRGSTQYTVHGRRNTEHGTRRGTYLNVHFE